MKADDDQYRTLIDVAMVNVLPYPQLQRTVRVGQTTEWFRRYGRPPPPPPTIPSTPGCHTVKNPVTADENTCAGHVNWARNEGVHNPDYDYGGLTPSSTFEDFQCARIDCCLDNVLLLSLVSDAQTSCTKLALVKSARCRARHKYGYSM